MFDQESIEGLVGIEGGHHLIAVGPHGAGGIDTVAVGVGVAGDVEPPPAPALAVMRRGEQAFDDLVALGGTVGGDEPFGRPGLGWQADEVQMDPAQPGGGRRRRRRPDGLLLKRRSDEGVDGVAEFGGPGWAGSSGRDPRPVHEGSRNLGGRCRGSVGDPASEGFDVEAGQRRLAVGHPFDAGMGTVDHLQQEASGGIAGKDCRARVAAPQCSGRGIQAESRFRTLGSVTGDAMAGEQGFDRVEVAGFGSRLGVRGPGSQAAARQEPGDMMGKPRFHGDWGQATKAAPKKEASR